MRNPHQCDPKLLEFPLKTANDSVDGRADLRNAHTLATEASGALKDPLHPWEEDHATLRILLQSAAESAWGCPLAPMALGAASDDVTCMFR